MQKLIVSLIAVSLLTLPLSHAVYAHGGGLDRHGCHNETATGGYHCHRKNDEGEDNLWLALGAVAGLGALLYLLYEVRKDQTTSLHIVPWAKDSESTGIALEYQIDRGHSVGLRSLSPETNDRDEAYVGTYWRLRF